MWCLEKNLFSNVMTREETDVKIPKKFLSVLQIGSNSRQYSTKSHAVKSLDESDDEDDTDGDD